MASAPVPVKHSSPACRPPFCCAKRARQLGVASASPSAGGFHPPLAQAPFTPFIGSRNSLEALHSLGVGHAQRPGFLSSSALVAQGKGGDVDLSALPAPLARICKQAWAALAPAPSTIIHADLTPSNLIQYETGEIGLVDWDECRVDLPVFDTGYLAPPRSAQVALALKAWEMACSWQIEPAYARGLVADVYRLVEEL